MANFRWSQVLPVGVAAGAISSSGMIATNESIYQHSGWQADSKWCVEFSPDGSHYNRDGSNCSTGQPKALPRGQGLENPLFSLA